MGSGALNSELPWPLGPLPWQAEPWSQLVLAEQQNTFPHALLLCGTHSIGKLHFARSLASFLLCPAPRSGTACGECRSCHLLEVGSHTDLLDIEPEEGSRVIKIDQVRALINFSNRTASLGARKVIVLGPAESLNVNAANALLKCLEEPADNTHLILVSHRPSALPATVRSRCQVIGLPMPTREASLPWLDRVTGSEAISTALLDASANKPLAAQALFLADGLETQQMQRNSVEALARGQLSAVEFPPLVSDMELADVLGLFVEHLQREIRRQSLGKHPPGRAAFELLDDILRLRAAVSRGGNPNRQLSIEDVASRIAQVL